MQEACHIGLFWGVRFVIPLSCYPSIKSLYGIPPNLFTEAISMGVAINILLVLPLALPAIILARAIVSIYRSARATARSYS